MADGEHRTKVTLVLNDEDVTRTIGMMFHDSDRAKFIEWPNAVYAMHQYDDVTVDGETVGVSTWVCYSANEGKLLTLAILDAEHAEPGTEVTLVWGEEGGGTAKPTVEPHVQTEMSAVVARSPSWARCAAPTRRAAGARRTPEPARANRLPLVAPLTVALLGLGEAGSALARGSRGRRRLCARLRPGRGKRRSRRASRRGRARRRDRQRRGAQPDRGVGGRRGRRRRGRAACGPGRSTPTSTRRAPRSSARWPSGRPHRRVVRRRRAHGRGPARRAAHAGAGVRAGRRALRRAPAAARHAGRGPGRRARRGRGAQAAAQRVHEGPGRVGVREPARRARGWAARTGCARRSRPCSPAPTRALLERLVEGSRATRRAASREVRDARELLAELGVEPRVTAAAGGWLAQLDSEGSASG